MNHDAGISSTIPVVDEETHLLTSPTTEKQEYTNDTKSAVVLSSTSSSSAQSTTTTTLWEHYLIEIDTHPVLTKCVTATIILSLSDVVAQIFEYYNDITSSLQSTTKQQYPTIDFLRTMRFGLLGLLGAPWSHYYFYYLDYYLPPSVPSDKYYPFTIRTVIKVGIDQCIQAPILLAIMILVLGCLKGGIFSNCLRQASHDISTTFMTSLIANWKLWIPASIINIAFVQPSLRVLYVNIIFFFWTILLSLMLNGTNQ